MRIVVVVVVVVVVVGSPFYCCCFCCGLIIEICSSGIDDHFQPWVTIAYNWAYLIFAAGNCHCNDKNYSFLLLNA